MQIKLNKSELAIGFCAGIAGAGFLGWFTFITAPLVALLWALGGSHSKAWRRVGVPCTLGFFLGWSTGSLLGCATILMIYGVLTLGYGIPTPDVSRPGMFTDKGSLIGRFWYDHLHQDGVRADIFTRATIGLLFGLSFAPLIPVGGWVNFLQAPGLCIMAFPMLSYLVAGQFEFNF